MIRTVVIANRHPRLGLDRRAVSAVIGRLDAHAGDFLGGCPPGELSLVFLTDAALAGLHGRFMGDPSATDVITFAGEPAAGLAGEICVSADTALRFVRRWRAGARVRRDEASKHDAVSFSAELTLYVVHGWLHLAGYDDLSPTKKRRMRAAEKRAMDLLAKAGALPEFRLKEAQRLGTARRR